MALIATLAMLAIACMILVAYVSMTQQDQQATASYTNSLKAEQLGLGSLQLVIAELQNEMAKDEAPDTGTNNAYPKYPVFKNVTSTNILPEVVGGNADMPQLVKTSSTTTFTKGALLEGNLKSTETSSTAKSANGRRITRERWSKVYLGEFPSDEATPKWILTTRTGPTSTGTFGTTGQNLNNPQPDNPNYAVGRFAYAIYDVGGLVDINVAGYPSSLTTAQISSLKGTLAGIDLSTLPNMTANKANDLVKWRNSNTTNSGTTYVDYVTKTAPLSGFMGVTTGDNTFASRQDLIKYAKEKGLEDALPNLTVFTRELNAPSWGPTTNATGASYQYLTNRDAASSTNRFLPLVRVTTAFKRDTSGKNAEVGEPLVATRFPLSRLAGLGSTGVVTTAGTNTTISGGVPVVASANTVQRDFGLIWNSGGKRWDYVGAAGTTIQTSIKTLAQVAAENPGREPNFMELLKAGILSGSLGQSAGATFLDNDRLDRNSDRHILQIAANIIDQYDADDLPTTIRMGAPGSFGSYSAAGVDTGDVYGSENLPYIQSVEESPVSGSSFDPAPTGTAPNPADQNIVLSFQIFNPHQNGNRAPVVSGIRVRAVQGTLGLIMYSGRFSAASWYHSGVNAVTVGTPPTPRAISGDTVNLNNISTAYLQWSDPFFLNKQFATEPYVNGLFRSGVASRYRSTFFNQQRVIATATGNGQMINCSENTGSSDARLVGFSAGVWPNWIMPDDSTNTGRISFGAIDRTNNGHYTYNGGGGPPPNRVSYAIYVHTSAIGAASVGTRPVFVLEVQDASGNWLPAQRVELTNEMSKGFLMGGWNRGGQLMKSDPRTNRFGFAGGAPLNFSGIESTDNGNSGLQRTWSSLLPPFPLLSNAAALNISVKTQFYRGGSGGVQTSGVLNHGFSAGFAIPGSAGSATSTFTNTDTPSAWFDPNFMDMTASSLRPTATRQFYPAYLANNALTSRSRYTDPDGVLRNGDSYLDGTANAVGVKNPWAADRNDRPVILNRPFRSVAELGFVFRDIPWKSLDFFSSNSADGGLLDIFTAYEEPAVVAGRVNLNTKTESVLAALLSGASRAETLTPVILGAPSAISSDDSKTIAKDIITATKGSATTPTPWLNRSELVNFLSTKAGTSSIYNDVKLQREASARALTSIGTTRTWNLLIDLVAQSGRYSPNATDLDKFMVDGERRYWLHLAIDRYTGLVVDQRLESVLE